MQNGPWSNTTICYQLRFHNFEDYFTTGRKDRYELLCDADAYDIFDTAGPYNSSIGVGTPLPIT